MRGSTGRRSFGERLSGVALSALWAALVATNVRAEEVPERWLRVTSPRFEVYAALPEDEVRATIERLEQFRQVVVGDCAPEQLNRHVGRVTLFLLPRARAIEQAFGLRSFGKMLDGPPPTVVTYGRPLRWLLVRSPLGPERSVLITRAVLSTLGPEPKPGWKPWQLRAYAAYYGTAELDGSGTKVVLGKSNTSALQAALEGPAADAEILDAWDGTAKVVGTNIDTVLEGASWLRLQWELNHQSPYWYNSTLGSLFLFKTREAPLTRVLGRVTVQKLLDARIQALLGEYGVHP
jgi:hypothetical protein